MKLNKEQAKLFNLLNDNEIGFEVYTKSPMKNGLSRLFVWKRICPKHFRIYDAKCLVEMSEDPFKFSENGIAKWMYDWETVLSEEEVQWMKIK